MLPTQDQIQTEAYCRWQRRGEEHGFDQADWFAAEDNLLLMQNYDGYLRFDLDAPSRTYFGCRDERKCRYCGKTSRTVTFRTEAHAIPHFVGNKSLFSYDECDECNKFFSETSEDSFGKLILPLRTIHGVSGKTGVPTYKTNDKAARIDVDKQNTHLAVTDRGASPLFIDDPDNKTLSAALGSQPYIPILAYKCLVKMALAIMPTEELQNFTHTLTWLMERNPSCSSNRVRSAACYIYDYFLPYPSSAVLLRRRTSDTPLPYMLFVLNLGRVVVQTYLPLTPMDNCFAGMKVRFPRMGSIVVPGKGESHFGTFSLASSEVVKDNLVDVVLSYESRSEAIKPL